MLRDYLAISITLRNRPIPIRFFIGLLLWLPIITNAQSRYEEPSWGLRVFAGEKYQNFDIIGGSGSSASFTPTSKNLAGIGYSHQYFNIDLGLRLTTSQEQQTERIDLQTSVLYNNHFFDIIAKRYKGFVFSSNELEYFREDIRSDVLGINYLRFHNKNAIDIKAIKSGRIKERYQGSLAYGGFFSYNGIRADSSIVTNNISFGPEIRITNLNVGTIGLQLGYFYRIWLINRIYVFGAIISGLGTNLGEIKASENYSPGSSPGLRLQIKAGCGYVRERYSISFVSDQSAYALALENDSAYAYGIGALKLAFSWRFQSENSLHHLLQMHQPRSR